MDAPIRVLVVEDDPLVLRFCRCTLERAGYAVWAAANAEEALAAPCGVSLAIVDLILPVVNGAELVRRLRERGMTAPVVCMSGYLLSDLPEVFSAYFLAKPFTPDQLLAIVETALEESR
jgi:DNA-binding response OmpR family regulator